MKYGYIACGMVGIAAVVSMQAQDKIAETDAYMDFLYKSMTLPDRTDYNQEFYRTNVESSLMARSEMPWGDSVPEREFRHFVLPVRVNNENLDMSRPVFYNELKERVKNLSMKEAILEVNHWCHEKVTYQPSDPRTSSPLSSVSQAIGRCGEESTFTVAALRSVGIPARQVYTPRWAHTDDNHAWVEAWADGQWWFLGACEPEPILNLAWFNAPASRGMLMHTAVYGAYDGPEEVVAADPYATVINVTRNYAPVAPVNVSVVNADGTPAENVPVDFRLYNYSEFYPLATIKTDTYGRASLTPGKGDLLAWASDGKHFGYAVVNAENAATIILDKPVQGYRGSEHFTLTPPPPSALLPKATPEQVAYNEQRTTEEDAIRKAYTSTFATEDDAIRLAEELDLNATALSKILPASRGNHKVIENFLRNADDRGKALRLLVALSEKDLRDISSNVLVDHLATPEIDSPFFDLYIMSPRVEWEGLTPYKTFFRNAISSKDRNEYRDNPALWAKYVKKHIQIDEAQNPKRLRMSPEGVWRASRGDEGSVKIMFVAGARAMGIPARMDPVTGKSQYADNEGRWIDVDFAAVGTPKESAKGLFRASEVVLGAIPEPKYYYHYSFSRLDDGRPRQLEYPEGVTLQKFLAENNELDEGQYMLVTGQRLADGTVLANVEFFAINADTQTEFPVVFPKDDKHVQVIGNLNSENLYYDASTDTMKSILSTTGRGYYVLGIIRPNHEPSEHALNDISALKNEFEARGEKLLLLCRDKDELTRFDKSRFPDLPSNVVTGADASAASLNELTQSLQLTDGELPVFVVADTFNRVVYVSSGYTIGMGEQLLGVLRQL